MVLAPRETLKKGVESLVSGITERITGGEKDCSPDLEAYWIGKKTDETWSTYVNRLNTRAYPYGLSYENGC